jgi:hypothetical protein
MAQHNLFNVHFGATKNNHLFHKCLTYRAYAHVQAVAYAVMDLHICGQERGDYHAHVELNTCLAHIGCSDIFMAGLSIQGGSCKEREYA